MHIQNASAACLTQLLKRALSLNMRLLRNIINLKSRSKQLLHPPHERIWQIRNFITHAINFY